MRPGVEQVPKRHYRSLTGALWARLSRINLLLSRDREGAVLYSAIGDQLQTIQLASAANLRCTES